MTPSTPSPATHENRLRRAAKRQGLLLVKSPRRDQRAEDYGQYVVVDDTPYNRRGRWYSSDAERERAYGRMRGLDSMDAFLLYPLDDDLDADVEAWTARLHARPVLDEASLTQMHLQKSPEVHTLDALLMER